MKRCAVSSHANSSGVVPRSGTATRRARHGFSLLEVVLAVALGVLLIAAISASIDQSWRLSTQGQTDLQRQQVSRAVLHIMERDLRSVMFVPPSEFAEDDQGATSGPNTGTAAGKTANSAGTGSAANGTTSAGTAAGSTGAAGSTSASGTATTITTIGNGTNAAVVITSRGLRGDQYSLEIDGSRAQRELAFAAPVNAALPSMRTSDLRTVTYSLAGGGASAFPGGGGLVRKEGDRYAVESAEMTGQNTATTQSSSVLAPEIIAMEFRYFDGIAWQSSWDSPSVGRLPRAIEVQLGFAPPASRQQSWLNDAANPSLRRIRLVIFLPAADPLPEETAS